MNVINSPLPELLPLMFHIGIVKVLLSVSILHYFAVVIVKLLQQLKYRLLF